MKKLVTLTSVLTAFALSPALAQADHHGGPHGGKMFEKHDLNGDGVISKDEFLKHAEEKFTKMDADGDGSVTKEESKAAMEAWREKMKEKHEAMKDGAEEAKDAVDEDPAVE